jgi:hypothetical protein
MIELTDLKPGACFKATYYYFFKGKEDEKIAYFNYIIVEHYDDMIIGKKRDELSPYGVFNYYEIIFDNIYGLSRTITKFDRITITKDFIESLDYTDKNDIQIVLKLNRYAAIKYIFTHNKHPRISKQYGKICRLLRTKY